MNYNDENLKKLIFDSIETDSVLKLVFSAPILKNGEEISKYSIKPVLIKDRIVYQVEYFKNNKAYHANYENQMYIAKFYLFIKILKI